MLTEVRQTILEVTDIQTHNRSVEMSASFLELKFDGRP